MSYDNLTERQKKATSETNARYAGKKFNMLSYVEHAYKWAGPKPGKNPIAVWKCDCGNTKEVRIGDVTQGRVKCCGCVTGRDGGEHFVGTKWSKLTLVETCGQTERNSNLGKFLCECGNTITAKIMNVRNGYKKSCGCDMSEVLRTARGFTLNEDVFDTITDDSAYWLGFLLADGNVHRNTITINLKTSDTPHLEKFRDFMGGNQSVSVKKDVRMSGYAFGSIRVAEALYKWGIVPAKSYIAKAHPDLEMNSHFWRGMVDGDGTINLKHRSVGLCGTEAVCDSFLRFAKTIVDTEAKVARVKSNLWSIRITCGRPDSVKLLETLYSGAKTYLDRKSKLAHEIMRIVEVGTGVNVTYDGVTYRTKKDAAETLGVSVDKLSKVLNGESKSLACDHFIPVEINGVMYETKAEAMRELGVGFDKLERIINGAPIENQLWKPVTINGVTYRSKTQACKELGVHFDAIERYLETGSLYPEKFIRVRIGGIEYDSIKEAARQTGIANNTIKRNLDAGTNYFKSVTYNGMDFKSVTKLAEYLGVDRHDVKKRFGDDLVFNYIEIGYV